MGPNAFCLMVKFGPTTSDDEETTGEQRALFVHLPGARDAPVLRRRQFVSAFNLWAREQVRAAIACSKLRVASVVLCLVSVLGGTILFVSAAGPLVCAWFDEGAERPISRMGPSQVGGPAGGRLEQVGAPATTTLGGENETAPGEESAHAPPEVQAPVGLNLAH